MGIAWGDICRTDEVISKSDERLPLETRSFLRISLEKETRVAEWYNKYYHAYFDVHPRSPRKSVTQYQWIRIIARENIPIGWCKQCGYHLDMLQMIWCPECGLREPLELRDESFEKYVPSMRRHFTI